MAMRSPWCLVPGQGGGGVTQAKGCYTHARPSMHMQKCSALLTGVLIASPSIKLNVLLLAVFC